MNGDENSMMDVEEGQGFAAWMLLMFEERTYGGNLGYDDAEGHIYAYDSFVQNHRQLRKGDLAFVCGRGGHCSLARIERIEESKGTKTVLICPDCAHTRIKQRRTIHPAFRCECGKVFDAPVERQVTCTAYKAHFGDSVTALPPSITRQQLQTTSDQKSTQMSIRRLDPKRLQVLLSDAGISLDNLPPLWSLEEYLHPEVADMVSPDTSVSSDTGYAPHGLDTRSRVMRQIAARRGQDGFRRALRARYGDRCMISGCELLDVIEASHISPYRGAADNVPENGLLLRADLHTLFDLDLIGIVPDSLTVCVHPTIAQAGYLRFDGRTLLGTGRFRPSEAALKSRWANFEARRSSTPPSMGSRGRQSRRVPSVKNPKV